MVKVRLGSVRASSLQPGRTAPLLLAGILAFGLGSAGHYVSRNVSASASALMEVAAPVVEQIADSAPARAASDAASEVHDLAASIVSKTPEFFTREVDLGKGQGFAEMLTEADVDPDEASEIAAIVKRVYDHKKLKAGQEISLAFSRVGNDETLTGLTFQPEFTKEISITRGADGHFAGDVKVTPIERQRVAARAEINSSLYEAGQREGVPRAVMAALLRAYSHAVDFQRDIHPGDKFEVLYDQPTAKDGTPVGQGVIIYAALEIGGKVKPLYRVTFGDGAVDYFDERGQSVKRSLLRTPVDGARVTSGFGMRMHPLLGFSKMHQGTDFGAPMGAPIFAAGSGVIEEADFKGGYGRYVRIRHNGKIATAYAHMSRFARDMYKGRRVNQGEVIGFVGSSGRSTGPHLHYEVQINGHQANPLSVNLPTGRVLEGQTLAQFRQGQSKIKKEFTSLLAKGDEPDDVLKASMDSSNITKVSSSSAAFGEKSSASCGLRGGC